jgi:hypothetical protein
MSIESSGAGDPRVSSLVALESALPRGRNIVEAVCRLDPLHYLLAIRQQNPQLESMGFAWVRLYEGIVGRSKIKVVLYDGLGRWDGGNFAIPFVHGTMFGETRGFSFRTGRDGYQVTHANDDGVQLLPRMESEDIGLTPEEVATL